MTPTKFRLRTNVILGVLAMLCGAVFLLSPSPSIAENRDGNWHGEFKPSAEAICRRPGWPTKAEIRGDDITFFIPGNKGYAKIDGDIEDDGSVKADGKIGTRKLDVIVTGYFEGNRFTGKFSIGIGKCAGSVVVSRRKSFGRSPGRAAGRNFGSGRLEAERQAKQKAEAEATEMKAQIDRLKAEQEALKKKAELAALQSKAASATRSLPGKSSDIKSELATLKKLRDDGLISQGQYESKQQALLDRAFSTKKSETATPKVTPQKKLNIPANINFGDYHALVIGINEYKHLTDLKTALADARSMAKLLKENYNFKITMLENPTRADIIDTLDDLRSKLKFKDNLLIYYAGHGWLDDKADQGFWLPADARPNRRSAWVSNDILTGTLKAIEAKHVMVVADSCYSGRLVRGANVTMGDPEYLKKMSRKKARVVITSGGLEPVADNSGDGHSPFTSALINSLQQNNGVLDGNSLFNIIRRPVMVNADQTPQFSDIRKAGHDGGDFLFVRRK